VVADLQPPLIPDILGATPLPLHTPEQTVTRLPLAALISSLALIGAACGGSDTADAPTTAAPTTAAPTTAAPTTAAPAAGGDSVDLITADVVSQASASGLVVDSACVADIVRKLSDADQQLLIDSIGDDMADPTLSAEGEALGMEIIGCADKDALVDMMMEEIGETPGADPECIRAALGKLDANALIELGESAGDPSSASGAALMTDMMACLTGS
jgi:hypothetical protein